MLSSVLFPHPQFTTDVSSPNRSPTVIHKRVSKLWCCPQNFNLYFKKRRSLFWWFDRSFHAINLKSNDLTLDPCIDCVLVSLTCLRGCSIYFFLYSSSHVLTDNVYIIIIISLLGKYLCPNLLLTFSAMTLFVINSPSLLR